jgi:hypothetical protein
MAEAKQVVERHVDAFNAHQADADPWAEDAEFVAPGASHSGVFRTPTGEVPATGRLVEFRWMSAYEARGDELASEHLLFDQVELLAQLGLM